VATGPQGPAASGRDRLRACHADREQVIETLKDAFVHGRLTRDELDARAGQALTARTYAELAVLTADIPPGQPAVRPARPPDLARHRPLARLAAGSGSCLVIAAAAAWGVSLADPGPPGPTPYHAWAPLCLLIAFFSALTALVIFGIGTAALWEQRRSRRELPPGGHTARSDDQGGGASPDPDPPGRHDDQTRAGLRANKAWLHRRIPAPAGQPRGVRSVPGTA
jgi:Domain of unknown function (DUF1707)